MGEKETIVIGMKHIIFVIVIIGLISAFIVVGRGSAESVTGSSVKTGDVNYQEVKVSMKANTYIFEPSTVNKDVPVKMVVDMNSVFGCYRDIVIPNLGVKKYVSESDNVIEFTPTKTGTMSMFCSMRMGSGSFKVV